MSTYANPTNLVSTAWLAERLDSPDIRVVDATYYLPVQGKNARAEYEQRHNPGAVFFDIDEIAATSVPLPHMLPSPEKFSARVRKLGLGDGNKIVLYDAHGMMSAARVWWTFRAFGHRDVAVLDGGLPKWIAEGHPVEDGPPHPRERHFTARFNNLMVRDKEQVRANIASKREQLVDARSAARFQGAEPEPWPGRRSGHIPGSFNLPYTDLLDPASKSFLPADRIRARFEQAGVDLKKPVICSCGSGITACVLAFADRTA
jgi:thiosulfate/3-mercaptopyruvate sulfurtransferase